MANPYLESYPYLDSLVGGWFHQDFDLDGNTLEEIVASYKKSAPPEDWMGVRADIQRFLRQHETPRLSEDFMRLFQPGTDPESWGMSAAQWLTRIAELLQ
jgi:hypothetical protein